MFGSGRTAAPGNSHFGGQENQTILVHSAWCTTQATHGTIAHASGKISFCAVKLFAKVEKISYVFLILNIYHFTHTFKFRCGKDDLTTNIHAQTFLELYGNLCFETQSNGAFEVTTLRDLDLGEVRKGRVR